MSTPEDIRKERNKSLVERLKAGDPLRAPIDHVDTWWPPRPIIEKDLKGMKRVYNLPDKEEGDGE
jgi:hypothetical protein